MLQPFESISQYCNVVCEQIRWKKARPVIAFEIENHLYDQRDAYIESGESESVATQKAIVQMGDAVSIGEALDKAHQPRPQWLMIFLTVAFMLLGMCANAWISATAGGGEPFHFWPYGVALFLFLLFYFLDFTVFAKIATQFYFVALLLPALALFLNHNYINGRNVWISGPFTIVPDFLALLFPFAFALLVYAMRGKGLVGILLSGAAYVPLALVLLSIPMLSGFLLYTLVAVTALCFAIFRGWFGGSKKQGLLLVLVPTAIVLCAATLLAIGMGQRYWNVFFNPMQDNGGAGFLYSMLRAFFSEAAFLGKGGVPQAFAELPALPYLGADYALAYLVHEFGLVVLLCLVLCVMAFSAVGVYQACKQKSVLGALLALTVIGTFALQCVLYIAGNLGYGMLSPLSLPLISHGNATLFVNAALVGVMLSVFRTGGAVRDNIPAALKSCRLGENAIFFYEDGKLTIHFKAGRV